MHHHGAFLCLSLYQAETTSSTLAPSTRQCSTQRQEAARNHCTLLRMASHGALQGLVEQPMAHHGCSSFETYNPRPRSLKPSSGGRCKLATHQEPCSYVSWTTLQNNNLLLGPGGAAAALGSGGAARPRRCPPGPTHQQPTPPECIKQLHTA
jgi:hypothetical protein